MLPGILGKKKFQNDFKPTNTQIVQHIFFSKGITMKQFNEDFTIPEIQELVATEMFFREKEAKAMKKKR